MAYSVYSLTNRLNYLQDQVNGIIASSDTLQEVIDNGDALQESAPLANQVITYDGTNVVWSDLPAPADQTLQDVINEGDLLEGVAPALDQVIKYNGTNVVWSDLPAPADQSLQDVINVSDVLNGSAPTGSQFIGYNGSTPIWTDLPFITLDEVVNESPDLNGLAPAVNQVIQYDGEFVVWSDLPPATPSLQEVITVNDDLQSTAPTLDQVIKYDGTNVVWSDLPPPATPTLASVLSAGNTASGTSASISLTNLPKQTIISPTSVFLNDTTIVQQATLNTQKLRLLTSGLTNDITSDKMSFTKLATSSINEYGTDGVALSGLFGDETRSGGLNLNTGVTINNETGKLSGTLNEVFLSLDGNTTNTVSGNKSTLNASELTLVNKATPSTTSSLSTGGLTVGITGSVLTASSSGLSSTNILNLNSTSQIDTNCSIRVLATPPSSAGRAILSNNQLSMQNVSSALQNTISSTSSSITNGIKTISMTVDGISSTGTMSLGTATVNLTTGSTGITQIYPSNTTALATTQYVSSAISAIPTPTLQSVTNQGNTITNGTKTLTLNVNGLDSTGEIVIGNDSSTTRLNGTTTAIKLKSTNYDTTDPATFVKLGDSLTTGSLDLGKNITTGIINLGSQMTTGNLNIMSNAQTTGSITMLNNAGTGKLFVYGGGIEANLIRALELKATNINPSSSTSDLKIGGGITDREIVMGENMITGGAIYIGSADSTINLVSNDCNAITQTTGNNTTRVATCAFVNSSIAVIPVPSLEAVITKNDDLQGATPTTNQFIKYNGTHVIWSDLPAQTTPSLQAVINVSDVLNSAEPTTNQVIQYNGSAVAWSDLPAPATPSLSAVLLAGNGAGTSNLNMNSQNITAVNNITVSTINNVAYPPILADGSVTAPKLANESVTNSKIAPASVTNSKLDKASIQLSGFGDPIIDVSMGNKRITNLANPALAQDGATKAYVDAITFTIPDGSITTAKLADFNVTTAKLADFNVISAKLADGSVATAKLADASVTTAKLADFNVTTAKLADGSVTSVKIVSANVTDSKLDKANIPLSGFGAPLSNISFNNKKITNLANPTDAQDGATKAYVDTITIPDGSITTAKLANGSVTTLKLADLNVTTAKLADLNVTTAKLADNSVTTAKIADANVTNNKLNKIAIPLSGFGNPTATVSFGNQRLNELANPIANQDAATKAYVDSVIPSTANFATLSGVNTFVNESPQLFTNGGVSLNHLVASGLTTTQNIFTTKTGGIVNFSAGTVTNNMNGTYNIGSATTTTTINGSASVGSGSGTLTLNRPFTPAYTTFPTSLQIGYTEVLPELESGNIVLFGGQRTWRWFVVPQGTYIVSGSILPTVDLNFFKLSFCALKVTPTGEGYDINGVAAENKAFSDAGATFFAAGLLSGNRMSISTTLQVPSGWTSIAFVTNCFATGTPTSTIKTAITLTRVA